MQRQNKVAYDSLAKDDLDLQRPDGLEYRSESLAARNETKVRHVYLDLGANWGNTLRLYRDIDKSPGPWDIYSLELSPSIGWYVDGLCKFLNGEGP
jgi:hypothetical protein